MFVSFDALWPVLVDISQRSNYTLFCVIDALDECELESQQIILDQLDQTFKNCNSKSVFSSNLHFLITSHPYPEIRDCVSSYLSKGLASYQAVTRDLKMVVRAKVATLTERKNCSKAVTVEVSDILEDKAEGTFLWVGISCDELARVQSRNAVKILRTLPRGLHSLCQILLDAAVATIEKDDRQLMVDMVGFVAVAQRPLTLVELAEACQLYPDKDIESRLKFTRELIDLCCLMIIIDGDCVWLSRAEFRAKEEHEGFSQLQAKAWVKWLNDYNCLRKVPWEELDAGFSPIHTAAQWGIVQIILLLLLENLEDKDLHGRSPLLVAAQRSRLEAVDLTLVLISNCIKERRFWTGQMQNKIISYELEEDQRQSIETELNRA
ncbi:hypothetical protein ETB97_004953 [Aspergillus alliaceus]|uniref:Nephrocystin 3-like N-terminal domain-containing protein n=1 Tax=Petromyces alliaceus TaxID=209559 RepID=A0A8H5ZYB1_PETAA|nr:hypothetical protein ETB97_004953 [Aspergillus burnettii]